MPILGAVAGGGCGVGVGLSARALSAGAAGRPIWAMMALQAALMVWAVAVCVDVWSAAVSLPLSAALLTLMLVDMAILRLPDIVTLPLIAAGLATAGLGGSSLAPRVAGAAVGWAAIAFLAAGFRRLRGREGIGMGDAKLLAAGGAWLGWQALPWTVLLACGLAFAGVGVRLVRRGRASLNEPVAFGAPLAAAIWLVWLYGAPAA